MSGDAEFEPRGEVDKAIGGKAVGGSPVRGPTAARVLAFAGHRPASPDRSSVVAVESEADGAASAAGSPPPSSGFVLPGSLRAAKPWTPPVSGALAAIFGVASLFKMAWILAPLAVLLAVVAGLRGHHGWAAIGLGTAIVGLAISPWFWTFLGLAWLYQMWG